MSTIYDFSLTSITGEATSLKAYQGKVLLLVNVASECGLTPQYAGLQTLYQQYQDKGLLVIGLPCNQFGAQEPGAEMEIKDFCETNYQVTFPLMAKINVKDEQQHPLYDFLTGDAAKFPGEITWNFEKFLINKQGEVIKRFSPRTEPDDISLVNAIEDLLDK